MTLPARILIVEDDESIRLMLARLLSREGYATAIAANGEEAVKALTRESYDVILLDLMMPIVSGFDVLEFIEREKPETMECVVVLTAAANANMARLEGKPVRRIMRKPFDLGELVAAVRECIDQ